MGTMAESAGLESLFPSSGLTRVRFRFKKTSINQYINTASKMDGVDSLSCSENVWIHYARLSTNDL